MRLSIKIVSGPDVAQTKEGNKIVVRHDVILCAGRLEMPLMDSIVESRATNYAKDLSKLLECEVNDTRGNGTPPPVEKEPSLLEPGEKEHGSK